MTRRLTAFVKKGHKEYVALCLELDVASSGSTIREAIENLEDAVREFLEYVHEEGLEQEVLPRPVSIEAVRDFLDLDQPERRYSVVNLKGCAMEVASVG